MADEKGKYINTLNINFLKTNKKTDRDKNGQYDVR
jgi:hypothetical protein